MNPNRRADDVRIAQLVSVVEAMDRRLRTVERLVWVAVGGVAVIGALIHYFLNAFEKILT